MIDDGQRFAAGLILTACLSAGAGFAADDATPPGQPASGPGGASFRYAAIVSEYHGTGGEAYWLFTPAQPTPRQAPLIVFNHGLGAVDPNIYGAWIGHLVRRGNIVVYPLYQDSQSTPANEVTPNAIAAVKDAIRVLEGGPVKPQLDKFGIVGHSVGGVISANLAALARKEGLPIPRAVMCVEPGKTGAGVLTTQINLADVSQIPAGTLLLSVTGDDDHEVGEADAKRIFMESAAVALADKDFVMLISDDHGRPELDADHGAPIAVTVGRGLRGAGPTVDALDFYGTWKLFDGLTDAAFYGRNRNYALGNTPEQRFMGRWSDGVPVKQMEVTKHPPGFAD